MVSLVVVWCGQRPGDGESGAAGRYFKVIHGDSYILQLNVQTHTSICNSFLFKTFLAIDAI